MTIVAMKKVTLCGLLREKRALLSGLQRLGCLHLEPLRPAPSEPEKASPARAEQAYKALKFLADMPSRRKQVRRDPRFDVGAVVRQAREVQERLRDVEDRRDFLIDRIKQIEPWGDLVFPPESDLAGLRLWFYVLPAGKRKALEGLELPWQIVHRDNRRAYVVLIAEEEPPPDILPAARTHTGALPLEELKQQLEEAEVEIEALVAERQALTRFIYLLRVNLAKAEDLAALAHASEQTRDEQGIFAVQGWVPVPALAALRDFADEQGLAYEITEPGPADKPPTLLVNPPALGAGTDLALFYQVPGYRDWDPALVLFCSFALFFAMIISDAGYGLVMAGLLGLWWQRLGASAAGGRFRTLAAWVVGATLLWGVLSGGYFGVAPPDASLLGLLHVIDLNDFDAMMKLSIVIGVLHIMLANAALAALNWRRLSVVVPKLGWNGAALGGLAIWLSGDAGAFGALGRWLLAGGLLAVFCFSSQRPLDGGRSALLRALEGLKALAGASGLFGDVLSYMRLFALGLASASLALTFNDLAAQAQAALPGLGLLIAILILLFGHALNFALAIMSGVVHGLRLNFIEFYKWGLSEEGYPFKAFARKEVAP